jgi:hypothetical protein
VVKLGKKRVDDVSKTRGLPSLALLTGALVAAAAGAHHSIGGEFDNSRQVTVEGIVTEYKLINPHTYIVVAVQTAGGSEAWTLTFGPATKLVRGSGWNSVTLKSGDRVTATGRPARKGLGMYLSALVKADGTVLIDELEE